MWSVCFGWICWSGWPGWCCCSVSASPTSSASPVSRAGPAGLAMQVKQVGHGQGGFGASACHLLSLYLSRQSWVCSSQSRGSAEWIAHNTNVVSRTKLHKYIFLWIVAVLPWEQCPCTLTNLRPESVSLPANSAMHKHCVCEKLCLWTTNSTVQEGKL